MTEIDLSWLECLRTGTPFQKWTPNDEAELKDIVGLEIRRFDLSNEIKKIKITYDSNDEVGDGNRMYISLEDDNCHKKREYNFCTDEQYLFPNGKLDSDLIPKLIRHELMHLKDVFSEDFKHDFEFERICKRKNKELWRRINLIWNIYIDSRLEDTPHLSSKTKDDTRKEKLILN